MSDIRIVYLVTLIDRHIDDIATVHESDEGAALRVAHLKERYRGYQWEWHERSKTWHSFDDGPRIRVERKELQP